VRCGPGHIAVDVDDLDAILRRVERSGWRIVGAMQTVQDIDRVGARLAYLRGPDRVMVELTEQSNDGVITSGSGMRTRGIRREAVRSGALG
jgi:hypothetical protein